MPLVDNSEEIPGGPEPTPGEIPQEGPPAGPSREARTWAAAAHLAGLLSFIGPLVVWISKKHAFPFVNDQGKEALNFQLSVVIYGIAAFFLAFAAYLLVPSAAFIPVPVVVIVDLVFLIVAAVRANRGEAYRYPIAIRFIR